MPTGRTPKYQPLAAYLAAQPGDAVTLTFAEIEAILGTPLPSGAYSRPFWASRRERWDMSSQAKAWTAVGWGVGKLAVRSVPPTVTFVRSTPDTTASPLAPPRV